MIILIILGGSADMESLFLTEVFNDMEMGETWWNHTIPSIFAENMTLHMGVSENVVSTPKPNGFADHYPVFKWLFHWEYTLFSDTPIFVNDISRLRSTLRWRIPSETYEMGKSKSFSPKSQKSVRKKEPARLGICEWIVTFLY